MKKRTRTIEKKIFLSHEENEIILANMNKLGIKNFSMYARKMLCDGYLIVRDFTYLKDTARELGRIATNLNTIAKRANSTKNIYSEDLTDITESYKKAKTQIATVISDLVNEEHFYKGTQSKNRKDST